MDAVDDKDLLPKKGLDEHGQLNQRHQIHCMHSGELPTPNDRPSQRQLVQ
jgi:hypothetical protein